MYIQPTLLDADTLTDIPGPVLMTMTEEWQKTIRERDKSCEGMTPAGRAAWIRQRAELVEAARAALGWKDLLLLSELEAAGEGAVRALGGPDGDFPAAPGCGPSWRATCARSGSTRASSGFRVA